MQIDPRQMDLFAVMDEVFGTNFSLQPSPGAAPLPALQSSREKVYNMFGPELELSNDEVDRFHRGGYRKLAASMMMGAIDEVIHAITPEAKEAALAYFTEEEGPLPFTVVLDWLGPPLDHFTPQQWADQISMNPSAASAGIHQYWRTVEEREADLQAREKAGADLQDGEGDDADPDDMYEVPDAALHLPVERPRGM